jgi:quercetin dioxygenase-like cupin family protein
VSASAASDRRNRSLTTLIPVGIALAALAALLLLPRLGHGEGSSLTAPRGGVTGSPARALPSFPTRAPGPAWGNNVRTRVPLQQRLEHLPDGAPYVFRVTELEMEPGAKIFEHRQLGVGAHLVVRGAITIEDLDRGTAATYQSGQAYFEGPEPLHRAQNAGSVANRVLMFDILPASRGFDGQQRFTAEGKHNEGEVRSGPYVQIPLRDLPAGPLMLRVTEMAFGPKAKTETHARLGPTIFYVQEGTATVRKDWDNSSMTYGTNGYFFESGREPFILENKPASPALFIAVELLPASLGDAPSTVPTNAQDASARSR